MIKPMTIKELKRPILCPIFRAKRLSFISTLKTTPLVARQKLAILEITIIASPQKQWSLVLAQMILPATPQRTRRAPRVEPTPAMAPVMVCVVDTGTPKAVAKKRVRAPALLAQKPRA